MSNFFKRLFNRNTLARGAGQTGNPIPIDPDTGAPMFDNWDDWDEFSNKNSGYNRFFLPDEAQFMQETRLREAQTISNFQPFGGNADTRLAQNLQNIYDETEGAYVPEYEKPINLNITSGQQETVTLEATPEKLVVTTDELETVEEVENEEITNEELDKTKDPMITAMVGAASQAMEGITGIVSGLVGQRKRKAEQRAAKRDFDNQMAEFRAIDTSNPFANVQNPYEDLTVNLQQAQFESQQQQLGMATAMGQMRGAAGSSGVAAMAQAMANQQSINLQRSAASIGQQESRNQALAAQGAERRETLLAQGEQESRRMSFAKQNRLLDLTSDRKIAADEAVAAARQSMVSGVGNLLGGAASGVMAAKAEDWFG